MQDTFISAAYRDVLAGTWINGSLESATPEHIFADILAKYMAAKGTQDPTITAGTVNFGNTENFTFNLSFDRESAWQSMELLCQAVEGKYAETTTPVFLDFWVDSTDHLNLTPTGKLDLGIDVGGYGGDYIKTSDWTYDTLPIKTDVWVFGAPNGGYLPLTADPYWVAVNGGIMDLAYTNATAQNWFGRAIAPVWTFPTIGTVLDLHWYKQNLPGPIVSNQGITISNSSIVPPRTVAGDMSLNIHVDLDALGQGLNNTASSLPWGSILGFSGDSLYWGMRFDKSNFPNAPWVTQLCQQPGDHFNFYNNTNLSETMGQVNGFLATVRCDIFLLTNQLPCGADLFAAAVDCQSYPMMMMSPIVSYIPNSVWNRITWATNATGWQTMFFPLGPGAGGTLLPTNENGFQSSVFNWNDVQEVMFGMKLGFLTSIITAPLIRTFDIYFADLMFVKQVVARGKPTPTDTTRTSIVTDTTIPNYQFAANKANAYQMSLKIPQSYVDYTIFGRPDLEVGHTFTAEGEKLLIRESLTGATKSGGYISSVKAWKPLPP